MTGIARLYGVWFGLSIGLSFGIGGWKPENQTRLMVLVLLILLWVLKKQIISVFSPLRPYTRFVVMGCVLAALVEGFHLISEPVFASLRIQPTTSFAQALGFYAVDLLFTLPAYVLVFSLIWFCLQRYHYSFWGYVWIMGLGQTLGDGGLAFFIAAPGMLPFLPYPMSQYHAINVLPFLAVRNEYVPATRKNGWLAIPALIVLYFICGALIRFVGSVFAYR